MKLAGRVACMREERNTCSILFGNFQRKRLFERRNLLWGG